jgi:UDP-glucuronate 4-epimerase
MQHGYQVIGLDSLSDYYDVQLKEARIAMLSDSTRFRLLRGKVEDPGLLLNLFAEERPDVVIHLAAQAGVRQSISNPRAYLEANVIGTFELLEAARAHPPRHLLIASSSSVYGANTILPYAETQKVDLQMSFYASSKKSTETMAHCYAHLFDFPITVFRFFTAYGPWGRPDMALFKFTRNVLEGAPIDVYNHGRMKRDFVYVADLVESIRLLIDSIPARPDQTPPQDADSLSPVAPWRVVNIGNSRPVSLMDLIRAIERSTGRQATLNLMPMQAGDVPETWADATLLHRLTGFRPNTDIAEGVARFVDWYRDYYRI